MAKESVDLIGGGDGESYLASVSDLMVGILFVFLIILMAFALSLRTAEKAAAEAQKEAEIQATKAAEATANAQRSERQLDEALTTISGDQRIRRELLGVVRDSLLERGIRVTIDDRHGVVRLPQELLFDSGSATLSVRGSAALVEVADVLGDILPCYSRNQDEGRCGNTGLSCPPGARRRLDTVLIEGHTDERPLKGEGRYADNWELALHRALNTYRGLTARCPTLDTLENASGELILSLAAYEARRPVDPISLARARISGDADAYEAELRENRRIDIRFIMSGASATGLSESVQGVLP